jgi:O-antigen/teichoic acid export membrane protein
MSRLRKAVITAGFAYAQFGVAIVSGIVLVPLTLHRVGATAYGLWLASGEVLGHAGMVELGVLGVLPWMIAEADGKGDRDRIRSLLSNAMTIAALVGAAYLGVAVLGWMFLPGVLRLTPADRATVFGPLAILVVANAVSYPLRVYQGVLAGLQDVYFNGAFSVLNTFAGISITAVMLVKGYGLYALAVGAALPSLVALAAAFGRTVTLTPDLLHGWPRPSLEEARQLFHNGTGVWLGTLGWALLAATNGIVITYLGRPEWVAVYACTSKLSTMATQLAWIVPDSGLVGLAQLFGERSAGSRMRQIVLLMLRLHLLLAGAAACGFLAFNPAFVTRWVGGGLFGGLRLNLLLAGSIIELSLIHGLIATASVLGNRMKVGTLTLVNGVVQLALSLVFGHMWGLSGIAAAVLVAGLVTAVPAGVALLRPSTQMTAGDFITELTAPWLVRSLPLLVAAAAVGWLHAHLGLVASAALAELLLLVYAWHMRVFYKDVPLHPTINAWMVRLRLITPLDSAALAGSGAALTLDQPDPAEEEMLV